MSMERMIVMMTDLVCLLSLSKVEVGPLQLFSSLERWIRNYSADHETDSVKYCFLLDIKGLVILSNKV